MAEITAELIKTLRERTGIGVGKCKEALEQAHGDIELAIENLRKAGLASAVKKEGRATNEGIIKYTITPHNVALVEVNAETDFVVKNERFQEFVQNLADEVAKTMPANVEDFRAQKFSKDKELTIDEYRATLVQALGENIQIRRIELFPKSGDRSIGLYSHSGGKLVTLVEIEGSNKFEDLAKDISMHIAAESPEYLSADEVPERVREHEKEIARAQIKNKPANIIEKIVDGKLQAYFAQSCLLNQNFVKDTSKTISQLVEEEGKKANAKIRIKQFLRWAIGG